MNGGKDKIKKEKNEGDRNEESKGKIICEDKQKCAKDGRSFMNKERREKEKRMSEDTKNEKKKEIRGEKKGEKKQQILCDFHEKMLFLII